MSEEEGFMLFWAGLSLIPRCLGSATCVQPKVADVCAKWPI